MIERHIDLWTVAQRASAICVTTNGTVKRDGRGVMGRGVAAQAAARFPGLDQALGAFVREHGNHVGVIWTGATHPPLVAFPVKHQWFERADPALIARSARELVELTAAQQWRRVLLPRPGCGNGQLHWPAVQPLLLPLDDRFVVVDLAPPPCSVET